MPPGLFVELNWDFKCEPDLQGYKDLLVELYSGHNFSKVGTYKVFERTTKCYENGCGVPGEPKEAEDFKDTIDQESRVNVMHNQPFDILIMRSPKFSGLQEQLALCRLNKSEVSSFTCGSLNHPKTSGYYNPQNALFFNPFENPSIEWMEEIRFKGVIGKQCLRFYQYGVTPVQNSPQGKFYTKVEMLLVSTISSKN